MSAVLQSIRNVIQRDEIRYTVHAQRQMAIRRITNTEVVEVIVGHAAEIIETYPEDKYSPSCLIYGTTTSGRILHVQSNHRAVIITAYEPDPEKWIDLKQRRTLSL